MATYNPRAGMPPRKKYKYEHKAVEKTVTVAKDIPEGSVFWMGESGFYVTGEGGELQSISHPEPGNIAWLEEDMDANALRGWLLGYMDSIGDQLPDLAQWRRIREEVGRSVVVKEAVKEEPKPEAPSPEYDWKPLYYTWDSAMADSTQANYAVGIGSDGQLYHIDNMGNRLNLCGND